MWGLIFGIVERCLPLLNHRRKIVSLHDSDVSKELDRNISFIELSDTVAKKLGTTAYLMIYLDECQMYIERSLMEYLYQTGPCSKNVKVVFSGTTALGNEAIRGMSEFDSEACIPLSSYTVDRVRLLLDANIMWTELPISEEKKGLVEHELAGTPKNILYFLKELSKFPESLSESNIEKVLELAYGQYKAKQNTMLKNLLQMGKRSATSVSKASKIFEKILMIFSLIWLSH